MCSATRTMAPIAASTCFHQVQNVILMSFPSMQLLIQSLKWRHLKNEHDRCSVVNFGVIVSLKACFYLQKG